MPYLRKIWQKNTEEERLLGVSLTGIMDNYLLSKTVDSPKWLKELKAQAIDVNRIYADKLGVPASAAITCVKPSGTVSQLTDTASGIHARHSAYYIRTVRGDNKDPLTQFMKDSGIPAEPCVMKPDSTTVFSFPTKSPTGAVTRNDMTALQQLELWKNYALHFCEHKPSVTITVKDAEWMAVGAWVYENFDICSGISFLPHSDHSTHKHHIKRLTKSSTRNLRNRCQPQLIGQLCPCMRRKILHQVARHLACTAGACELVDI
jgi:ribonucleoside-triphosphate reductase (thioredoxin)